MFLKKLVVKNFRSLKKMQLSFNKGINILIGENNSGKSAIIDVLRICFGYGKQRRDIWIRNDEDFHLDTNVFSDTLNPIEFHLYFQPESRSDCHHFTELVVQDKDNPDVQQLELHAIYKLEITSSNKKVLKWNVWGGENEGQSIPSDVLQRIYYTYLAPLRDAEHELRPYVKENKITSLLKELTKYYIWDGDNKTEQVLTKEKKQELAKQLENVVNGKDWKGLINTSEEFINEHLFKADISTKESAINLRLSEYQYENIVKSILVRKPVYKKSALSDNPSEQKYFDVSQNGLGENNLILAAAVLGDLKNRREEEIEDYYALLVEEPEAHLHPQKQNTFFNYLNSLTDTGIQIFITSHSPTITAKSNLDNLIILQKVDDEISSFAIKDSILTDANKKYLSKFLDVTKSQLFFSNGTILVEGISEALILPALANIIDTENNLDKNGVEIININGVAFEPFAKLYTEEGEKPHLPTKCLLLTDDDRGIINEEHFKTEQRKEIFTELKNKSIINCLNRFTVDEVTEDMVTPDLKIHIELINSVISEQSGKYSFRASKAKELNGGNLKVVLNTFTFEYELCTASIYNCKLMQGIYRKLHPRTKLIKNSDLKEMALNLLIKLYQNKDKSNFAQQLAYYIDKSSFIKNHFVVPERIKNGIQWLTSNE